MFLYNITYKVDTIIATEWVQWQKEIHIPAIMDTGYFYEYHFYELTGQDDTDGKTFPYNFYQRIVKIR